MHHYTTETVELSWLDFANGGYGGRFLVTLEHVHEDGDATTPPSDYSRAVTVACMDEVHPLDDAGNRAAGPVPLDVLSVARDFASESAEQLGA